MEKKTSERKKKTNHLGLTMAGIEPPLEGHAYMNKLYYRLLL